MSLDGAEPLLISADESLIADVRRLAAAAAVTPLVVRDPLLALPHWVGAPVVLVGADLALAMSSIAPPRRPRVHVLASEPTDHLAYREALELGAESLAGLPSSQTWLVEMLTDVGDESVLPGRVTGVIAGSGGAGATTLAAALAWAARDLGSTILVDCDPLGAGVDRVLGMEELTGVRWDALARSTGRLSGRSLRETVPTRDRLSVLSWPVDRDSVLEPFVLREVISAARRGFDWTFLDLPRQPGQAVDEALARCDEILLLSTLTVPAVTAATRLARRLPAVVPVHLVCRGGRGQVSARDVATLLELPLLAAMNNQRGLDEAVNLGVGPMRAQRGALARTARTCLQALSRSAVAA